MAILDPQGNEVATPPGWHLDVNPRSLLQWCGHWFTFEGVDPEKPEIIFFRYKEPTKSTTRRNNAARN